MPHSPALSAAMSLDSQPPSDAQAPASRKPPFFFREEYAGLIVKGNFMTLAAKPKLVEEGEWLAHQGNFYFIYFTLKAIYVLTYIKVVEQYRLLEQMIDIIKVVDERTGRPVCNPEVCPTMSASGFALPCHFQKQPNTRSPERKKIHSTNCKPSGIHIPGSTTRKSLSKFPLSNIST